MRAPQNNLGHGSEAMSSLTNDKLEPPCVIRSQEQVESSFKTHYDVIVVGGGAAGIGAAFGARQAGASVLLIEATGCLGGRTSYTDVLAVRADGYVY
jgi:heterodisulfide reductase subunit A-like polyferredoxin